MKKTYSHKDVLAFIDAARRLPNTPEKEIYVRWLVSQFELRCNPEVIKPEKTPKFDDVTKYNKGE